MLLNVFFLFKNILALIDLFSRSLWIGIYLFGALLLTGIFAVLLSLITTSINVQQLSKLSKSDFGKKMYNSIAWMYYKMDDCSNALLNGERALEIQEQSLSSNDSNLAYTYDTIGMIYCKMSEHSKALSYYQKAIEIVEQLLAADDSELCEFYSNIGEVYDRMGNYIQKHFRFMSVL